MHPNKVLALFAVSALAVPTQDSDHDSATIAAPVEDSFQGGVALTAAIEDTSDDVSLLDEPLDGPLEDFPEDDNSNNNNNGTTSLHRRADNCYHTGTKWKPNNGQVLQLMNDVCLQNMQGIWKKNEKVSKCRGISSHALFAPTKSMWLEIHNRRGRRNLSTASCAKMLRTMFDVCSRGGEYTNRNGWFIK